ncbi:pyridoxamine 5'-phosphate oxidase [Aquimarina sp. 2201CG5-10]|uniref:pyridoxamine 5'-phosphate oxidase n=1 Tax=Aquimarina callyspongiae TaxID=3098150 RepID=UPI002AB492C2|nr:pyridoxamine 5'-phosphate oxidase [Aquimarina sp. 2201CG5-10]MDY8134915.1 pyridoxamine 5'-phosphate oxidase [Aquimarina sp. 2201CG5-10]
MKPQEDYNPIEHFQKWFLDIDMRHPEEESNVMALSTIGLDGYPKTRIVLLKRFTWEGFIFFTNYKSEKGRAIDKNNRVSLLFNWESSNRKISITGTAEKIAKNLSEGYFESRPEGSKLSTLVSKQSEVVVSRKTLEERLIHYEKTFKGKTIPKPAYWGGYLVKPQELIFTKPYVLSGYNQVTTYRLQSNYDWSKKVKYKPI